MQRLLELLDVRKMTLMVALPSNNIDFAEAAVEGGADALVLGINLKGVGGFAEERENLIKIAGSSKVPVGIIPGREKFATEGEMREIVGMGFDFYDMPLEQIPEYIMELRDISHIISLNSRYTIDKLLGLSRQGTEAVDAAIIPSSGWGSELVVGDLQNYISIVLSAGIPVIIPTERSIKASEVAIIYDTGAKGLLLNSVVAGNTAKSIKKTVQEFKAAIEDLGD